jgi:hypothetical protein
MAIITGANHVCAHLVRLPSGNVRGTCRIGHSDPTPREPLAAEPPPPAHIERLQAGYPCCQNLVEHTRKVAIRLPGGGHSKPDGTRPDRQISSLIKRYWTRWLPIDFSISLGKHHMGD